MKELTPSPTPRPQLALRSHSRTVPGRGGAWGWACLLGVCGSLITAAQATSPVLINEFLARNDNGIRDEDGERRDWIELRNVSTNAVNLEGWALTDNAANPTRWRFPATNLTARSYLVVFASGKDRRTAGLPLHTDFRLDSDGEYLALVLPDGRSVANAFAPAYPTQYTDVSYGAGGSASTIRCIARGATARFLVPASAAAPAAWQEAAFDDTAWEQGRTGLGFSSGGSLSAAGLYGYWPADEGVGDVAANRVAEGPPARLYGATWATDDPQRGTVLSFDGGASYVAAGTIPRMGQTAGHFTWSFWYRQRSVPNGNAVILGNRAGGAPGALQFIKFTPTNFEYYRDGDIGFIPHAIASGVWRHLAVVKAASTLTYYDDGTVVGTSQAAGDIEANPFYWGGDPGAPGECADGFIDDVSLWTTALTPDQIHSLQAGVSPLALTGLGSFVATDLGARMRGVNTGVYIRLPFAAPTGTTYSGLKLRLQYKDGFVAWLNGVEVARRNAPAELRWDSAATAERSLAEASVVEEIDLSAGLGAIVGGTNVLAIQGLSSDRNGADFLLLPELEATETAALGERFFVTPTPGADNGEGLLGIVADLQFDRERGFYDAPFDVAIRCATAGATIRYTTDGTEPTLEHGSTYESPIRIAGTTVLRAGGFKAGFRDTPLTAQSYLFLDQVLLQDGAGLPTAWGNDWRMDPRVVTNAAYASRIRDDLKSLPVVSVALAAEDLWGGSGIYTQTSGRGEDYERPCSAEMFFPDGSREGFQIQCGLQIVGSASRFMSPKHGLGLTFKSRYGPSRLKYRFFEDSPVDEFDFLAFRPNFNMSWVRTDNSGPLNNSNSDGAERLHAIYVRDQFTKESQLAMGQVSAHERFVHLYLNGLYWGLYNPSERTDAAFAASYLGGDPEDYDAIFSDPSTVARAHDGDKSAWNEMMALARAGLTTADAYAQIQRYLDVTNLADYMMLNFYCATVDWPWQNWNATRSRREGGRFRFHAWDAEYTLETPPWVPADRTGVGAGADEADSPAFLYYRLRQNAEWRLLFADRVRRHCFGSGALTTNQATARFLRLCDTIDRAIVGESARWGDVVRKSEPYTRDLEWLTEKNRLLSAFFARRTDQVVQQFVKAGLYPSVAAPDFEPAEGPLPHGASIGLTAAGGTIYYTTDGSDPRAPGGAFAPGARVYTDRIVLAGRTTVMARAWQNGVWSALSVADYPVESPPPTLSAQIVGTSLQLTWPAEYTGFILEASRDLLAPRWSAVPGVAGNRAIVNANESSGFYRLRRP